MFPGETLHVRPQLSPVVNKSANREQQSKLFEGFLTNTFFHEVKRAKAVRKFVTFRPWKRHWETKAFPQQTNDIRGAQLRAKQYNLSLIQVRLHYM